MTESSKQRSPREFWLDICTPYGDPCDFIHTENPYEEAKRNGTHPCVSATNIHVIEASYANELEAKLAVAVAALESIEAEYLEDQDDIDYNPRQNPAFILASEALEQIKKMKAELDE